MSPSLSCSQRSTKGFPRVSGDEPALAIERLDEAVFSPREWG